jgi:ADP-ribose pyrophosphatase
MDREILYDGKYLRLMRTGHWEYAERVGICGIVGIVAVTPEGALLLVEQHRPPVHAPVIELPAGLAGDHPGTDNEALADAAARELLEETGYAAETMTLLTAGPPSAGTTSEVITLFRADGLRRAGDGGGDHTESITVHAVPLPEVPAWLEARRQAGALIDQRIYTGLWFLAQG